MVDDNENLKGNLYDGALLSKLRLTFKCMLFFVELCNNASLVLIRGGGCHFGFHSDSLREKVADKISVHNCA